MLTFDTHVVLVGGGSDVSGPPTAMGSVLIKTKGSVGVDFAQGGEGRSLARAEQAEE